MHTPEQVRELLEIIEIEDDKIDILLKEQSLEQAHTTIDIDLLVIYYNFFQYEETWEHISQVLEGSISGWIRFIENQHVGSPVHKKGIQTLIKRVFVHINPWFKYEKAWKELFRHCEVSASDANQFKDWLIDQLFEDPPPTLEASRILVDYASQPKLARPSETRRCLTDEEFQHVCELEDSILHLKHTLDSWYETDTTGKMERYAPVLEKIAEFAADLDNVRYVWDFIKKYEDKFKVREEEVKLLIRRTAFKEYKLPTVVNPMFF